MPNRIWLCRLADLHMLRPQRDDGGGSGSACPAGLGSSWNEAVEIRSCDLAEALAQGREIVAEPDHVPGVMADRAWRVVTRFEVDDEIADLRDDGIAVIGGPCDFAAGQNNSLEIHERAPTCRGQAEATAVHDGQQTP